MIVPMNRKSVVAILLVAAVPVCAQAQKPSAAKVTKADAQKVVKIISSDKAKTQTYCDMTKLGEQIEQANEKKDQKMVNELSPKLLALGKKLGPEYNAYRTDLAILFQRTIAGHELGGERLRPRPSGRRGYNFSSKTEPPASAPMIAPADTAPSLQPMPVPRPRTYEMLMARPS